MDMDKKDSAISALQKARRQSARKFTTQSFELEGVFLTDETNKLLDKWVNDEMSTEDLLAITDGNKHTMDNWPINKGEQFAAIRGTIMQSELLVRGDFDKQHLMDIHAFIFKPFCGDDQYRPGELREETPAGYARTKQRKTGYTVCYSRMDKEARNRLDTVLEEMKPKKLYKLDKESLTKQLSDNYAELDYLHPFEEGNSRTLREFFTQCAEEIGYKLELDKENGLDRNALYKARDRAVLEKAYDDIEPEHQQTRAAIKYLFSRELGKEKPLEDFFKENLYPMDLYQRAAFKNMLKLGMGKESEPQKRPY